MPPPTGGSGITTSTPPKPTEYQSAFDHGAASAKFEIVANTVIAALPEGYDIHKLDYEPFLPKPSRIRAKLHFTDVGSFHLYVNEYKSEEATIIFANRDGSTISAIINYHADASDPSWCTHHAVLGLRFTPEWTAWKALDRQAIGQEKFAEFIEDHGDDVIEPSGASMLEMATKLQSTKSVSFKSGMNLTNGGVQFEYIEDIQTNTGAGSMTIPTRFKLRLAIYQGGQEIEIPLRLRYKISDRKLAFTYLIDAPHRVMEAAFNDVLNSTTAATGLTPLIGSYAPG